MRSIRPTRYIYVITESVARFPIPSLVRPLPLSFRDDRFTREPSSLGLCGTDAKTRARTNRSRSAPGRFRIEIVSDVIEDHQHVHEVTSDVY